MGEGGGGGGEQTAYCRSRVHEFMRLGFNDAVTAQVLPVSDVLYGGKMSAESRRLMSSVIWKSEG